MTNGTNLQYSMNIASVSKGKIQIGASNGATARVKAIYVERTYNDTTPPTIANVTCSQLNKCLCFSAEGQDGFSGVKNIDVYVNDSLKETFSCYVLYDTGKKTTNFVVPVDFNQTYEYHTVVTDMAGNTKQSERKYITTTGSSKFSNRKYLFGGNSDVAWTTSIYARQGCGNPSASIYEDYIDLKAEFLGDFVNAGVQTVNNIDMTSYNRLVFEFAAINRVRNESWTGCVSRHDTIWSCFREYFI